MEARRREQQRRRDSAKSSAVQSLPSTQEKEFNLRLIDIYSKFPCLWNQSLKEFEDVELKRLAWEKITDEMGAHMNSLFLRSRLNDMQQQFNIYKLQMINNTVQPYGSRKPEKPYFFDKLALITEKEQQQLDGDQTDDGIDLGTKSIAGIVKQRIQQQGDVNNLKHQIKRFGQSDEIIKPPLGNMESVEQSSKLTDDQELLMGIPSVVKKRLPERYNIGRRSPILPTSTTSLKQLPSSMRAKPGDSVSKTKLTHQKTRPIDSDESQTEDEDLHRLHWIVRQEGRSLRRFGNARKYVRPHLLGTPSPNSNYIYK